MITTTTTSKPGGRVVAGVALALATFVGFPGLVFGQPSADELLVRAENSIFPNSFQAEITLVTREGGEVTSEMQLSLDYKQDVGSYMEILSPARSRGLRFLQIDDTLWMYNPRAGGDARCASLPAHRSREVHSPIAISATRSSRTATPSSSRAARRSTILISGMLKPGCSRLQRKTISLRTRGSGCGSPRSVRSSCGRTISQRAACSSRPPSTVTSSSSRVRNGPLRSRCETASRQTA